MTLLWSPPAVFGQPSSSTPAPSAADSQEPASTPAPAPASSVASARRRWQPYVGVTSAFDSNLEHARNATRSAGGVIGGGFFFRNNPADPTLELNAEVAAHQWSQSTRWDRVSEKVRLFYARDLPGRWSVDTAGEITLKGSSEDRELSDQYVILPRLAFRLGSQDRVRVYAALRARRYDDDPDRNAFNRYVGVTLTERPQPNRRWELDLRYEVNATRSARQHYNRWTYAVAYFLPLGRDLLEAEARYRMQYYPFRQVEVAKVDVNRRDHRWIPRVAWTHPFSPVLSLRTAYTFETRTSNDLDREFNAHLFSLGLSRQW